MSRITNLSCICKHTDTHLRLLRVQVSGEMKKCGMKDSQAHKSFIWEGRSYSLWNKEGMAEVWRGSPGSVHVDQATEYEIFLWLMKEVKGGL